MTLTKIQAPAAIGVENLETKELLPIASSGANPPAIDLYRKRRVMVRVIRESDWKAIQAELKKRRVQIDG